jgi:hypothetical protein
MSETQLLLSIRDALLATGRCAIWRCNSGRLKDATGRWVQYGLGLGCPDLIGMLKSPLPGHPTTDWYHGRFLAVEVKLPGKHPEKHQLQWHKAARNAGRSLSLRILSMKPWLDCPKAGAPMTRSPIHAPRHDRDTAPDGERAGADAEAVVDVTPIRLRAVRYERFRPFIGLPIYGPADCETCGRPFVARIRYEGSGELAGDEVTQCRMCTHRATASSVI